MLPFGRALLDEGARSLDTIGAAEGYAEGLLLEAQARVFFHREGGSKRGLRLAERDCGFAGDFLGQLASGVEKFGGRHDLVDEAELQRRLRVEHLARHDQLARLVVADSMRQPLRPAKSRNKSEIYLGLPESRFM